MAACYRVKEENKVTTKFIDESSEIKDTSNNSNIDFIKISDPDSLFAKDDDQEREVQASWIDIGNIFNLKEKFIRIFTNDIIIPKQC